MSVETLLQEIQTRRADQLVRHTKQYPRSQPIASDLSPCERETALAILHWADRPLPEPDLKARFERGNLLEDAILRELGTLGLRVRVERTPFELMDRQGRVILRGSVDGFIEWGEAQARRDYPFEVKSLDPNVWRQVHTADDFQRWPWARKYPRQLQAYCFAHNLEEAFFLLDDCLGHWKCLPVRLDYEAMEQILRQCEAATEAVHRIRAGAPEAEALAPYHAEPAVCRRCWAFGRLCTPPMAEPGYTSLVDEELEQQLDRRATLQDGAREYEALDKSVKARVRGKDGLVVGRWLVRGKEQRRRYPAKGAHESVAWVTTFEPLEPKPEETT